MNDLAKAIDRWFVLILGLESHVLDAQVTVLLSQVKDVAGIGEMENSWPTSFSLNIMLCTDLAETGAVETMARLQHVSKPSDLPGTDD